MTEHDTDILDFPGADRLRAAGNVTPPTPAALDAALEAVRAARREESAPLAPAPARPSTPRRHRRILAAAAVIAAVAAGAAVYPTIGVDGTPPAATADAADFLHHVARTAGGEHPSDAPYWKVRTRSYVVPPTDGAKPIKPISATRTVWLSRDALITAPADGTGPGLRLPVGQGEQMSWDAGNTSVTWDDLKTLPTEPTALRTALLHGERGPKADEALFNGIDSLLSGAPSGPRLRAALYDVLAGIPGVRLDGPTKDSTGRPGTAVELGVQDRTSRLIIDPAGSHLLELQVLVRGGTDNGHLVSRTTYLTAEPARKAPPTENIHPRGNTAPRPGEQPLPHPIGPGAQPR